mgnify:CR=1 FL=1
MTQDKPKPADDLRMPADVFDRIMRKALDAPPPADNKKPSPTGRQPRKADRAAKK